MICLEMSDAVPERQKGDFHHSTRRRTIAILFAFLLTASSMALGAASAHASAFNPKKAIHQVSADEIMKTVQTLEDFGSRAFYTAASHEAGIYIHDRFVELGLRAEYEPFSTHDHVLWNVVATLDGELEDAPQYLFGAHYDSENAEAFTYDEGLNLSAPGADDDASGVAVVLELARVLAHKRFENTIKFVAFTAEEWGYDNSGGLKGSQFFVSEQKNVFETNYAGTAILDMVGYKRTDRNLIYAFVNKDNDSFLGAVRDAIPSYDIDLTLNVSVDPAASFSDQFSFWQVNYPSFLLIEEMTSAQDLVYPYYHTEFDTSDKLSKEQMSAVAQALLGGLLALSEPIEDGILIYLLLGILVAATIVIVAFYVYARKGRSKRHD